MSSVFEQNVIKTWGEQGRYWLKTLPKRVDTLAKQWHLTNLTPVNNLSYNYVLTGYQDQTPVVLKLGCDHIEMQREWEALKDYNGNGSIRLIESNLKYKALLLEQAIPGTSLVALFPDRDDEALEIAAKIMQQLHAAPIPSNANLPTLHNELVSLYKPHPGINAHHFCNAQDLARILLQSQPRHVLLHGDLHHDNILLSQRSWLAIDPKGLVGDPAYEVCAFIRNPYLDKRKSKDMIRHRVKLFAQRLSLDEQRLYAWVYVRAVLGSYWATEEGPIDLDVAEQLLRGNIV